MPSDFCLSQYQKAVLNELGIALFQLTEAHSPAVESELEASLQPSQPECENALEAKSVPDTVLCCFEAPESAPFWQDVLLALPDKLKPVHVLPSEVGQFKDYRAVWQLDDRFALNHDTLITPKLFGDCNAAQKRQLWQHLQNLLDV